MTLAIVTGGSTGIGLAIVRALLDQNVASEVVVWDLRPAADEPLLDGVTQVVCDVTDEDSVLEAFASLGRPPSILVNNAGGDPNPPGTARGGLAGPDPFGSVEEFRRMVDLNFVSAHVVTSVVGPSMPSGSAICNTASIAGQRPGGLFAYGAAKAAMIHWTKSMALYLGERRVRVNAVAPGIIRTRLWEEMAPERAAYDAMIEQFMPLGSDQSPSDIANAVAFLCSDAAAQITGQVIAVDGGMTLGRPPAKP
ncbi:MAG: SDR family oxidoreductase [Acidimicrobiales bacterium]